MYYKELPDITEKQKEIVNLVFQYRFINRHQIQRYLNHKDAKRINTWLKDLVEKKYLGRIYSRKLLENTKPAIYFLQNNGILQSRFSKGEEFGVLNEQLEFEYVKKYYKDKNASNTFVNHCVSVCEVCIKLIEIERESGKQEYEFLTKTEESIYQQLWGRDYEEIKELTPDVIIYKYLITKNDVEGAGTYLLELFDENTPSYAIRYKIKQFVLLYQSESWKNFQGADLRLPSCVLIFPNQNVFNRMSKYLKKQLEEEEVGDAAFLLTTHEKAVEGNLEKHIWKMVPEQ